MLGTCMKYRGRGFMLGTCMKYRGRGFILGTCVKYRGREFILGTHPLALHDGYVRRQNLRTQDVNDTIILKRILNKWVNL